MLLKIFGWLSIFLTILACILGIYAIHQYFAFDPEMETILCIAAGLITFLSLFSGILIIAIGDMQLNLRKLRKTTEEILDLK